MVYYSRRQCTNPDDCADAQTPSPTVERVLNTVAPSSAPDDHKLLRAYVVLGANLILFLAFRGSAGSLSLASRSASRIK